MAKYGSWKQVKAISTLENFIKIYTTVTASRGNYMIITIDSGIYLRKITDYKINHTKKTFLTW